MRDERIFEPPAPHEDGSPPFESRHIGMRVKMLSTLIRRRLNRACRDEDDVVTGSNGWILGYLVGHDGQDVFQRDLEEHINIRRATVSKTIGLMVQKGLIERQPCPYDARLKKLVITDKGRRIHENCDHEIMLLEEDLRKGIPPEKLEIFFEVCEMMKDNLLSEDEKKEERTDKQK